MAPWRFCFVVIPFLLGACATTGRNGWQSPQDARDDFLKAQRQACTHLHDASGKSTQRRSAAEASTPEPSRSKPRIKAVIDSEISGVRSCYQQALRGWPNLQGTIRLKFAIANDGKVLAVDLEKDTTGLRELACCIAGEVREWSFEPATRLAVVSYPFILRP
jgi:hypothetical protein